MYFKKINIFYFIITLLNFLIFINNLNKSNSSIQYCLLSDVQSLPSYSINNKNYLESLKVSLKNEVIDLEKQREVLLNEILSKTSQLNKLNNEIYHLSLKSYRIRHSIISLQQIRKDYERRHKNEDNVKPIISRFNDMSSIMNYAINLTKSVHPSVDKCTMNTCIDYNRCSFSNGSLKISLNKATTKESVKWTAAIQNSMYHSYLTPCIIFNLVNTTIFSSNVCKSQNCVLLVFNASIINRATRSIIVQPYFTSAQYRHKYDIVTSSLNINTESIALPLLFPIQRRYLLSFTSSVDVKNLSTLDKFVIEYLRNVSEEIQKETGNNNVYIDVNCLPSSTVVKGSDEWILCQGADDRLTRLKKSKFCLVMSPTSVNILSTEVDQQRLIECLLSASIPVVLGDLLLPFDEIIDWHMVLLRFPKQRVKEVISVIENIPDSDCFQMKWHGRSVLENYLLSPGRQIDTTSLILTRRLGLPLRQSLTHRTQWHYTASPINHYNFSLPNFQIEMDPYLGPSDVPPTSSNSFVNNYAQSSIDYKRGGSHTNTASYLYPSTPWDSQLSTDLSLRGHLARGYLAINHTINEAGTEFMHSLGGNFIYEQFTIVILSYKRHDTLRKSLELLNDLPYLHSIIIVWNDPEAPPPQMKWPKLHVEIKIVNTSSNSLNNRFLPYDAIKTDAVLSFDDDMQLRHDEIIFAFRVWRENRDRIVGFISRYHSEYPGPVKDRYSKNQWWIYNVHYTCEYSMILTGAAFVHRFYFYAYSNDMNPKIRQIVNKHKNCEDIAMNFLVSHITRKPPIKVTVRWTLSCINCDTQSNNEKGLHTRPDHYTIRSDCLNEFATIYGYNPLLYSQYRADSVLFKTRLPANKQKCFRYI